MWLSHVVDMCPGHELGLREVYTFRQVFYGVPELFSRSSEHQQLAFKS